MHFTIFPAFRSFAVAGVLELASDFYTTGCDVEVIEADERDP